MFVTFAIIISLIILFSVISRSIAAKKRLVQQAIQMTSNLQVQQPQGTGRRNITVTVNPASIENAGQMSEMAQNILKSMGGADGILNMPEVRDALRNAAQHPGMTTTVMTTNGDVFPTSSQATSSPFDTTNDPFAQTSSPFAPAPPPVAAPRQDSAPQVPAAREMGVAQVLSAPSTTFDGTRELSLELDAIGSPKRRVTATLTPGQAEEFTVGSRIYVHLDQQNTERVTLLTSNQGNNVLPTGPNRLDPIVLGPQIFRNGSKGAGVVKAATQVDDASGGGSWKLELEITPERGWPYRAELLTTVSTPEKAARICVVGAQVPVLYDPDDPKTMCVDSVSMGYGNPFQGR